VSDALFSLVRAVFFFRGERRGGCVVEVHPPASDSLLALVVIPVHAFVLLLRGEHRGEGDVGVPGMLVIWKISAGV
jgi:hypothetical protein